MDVAWSIQSAENVMPPVLSVMHHAPTCDKGCHRDVVLCLSATVDLSHTWGCRGFAGRRAGCLQAMLLGLVCQLFAGEGFRAGVLGCRLVT